MKNDMMETNTGEADEMIAEVDVGYEVECIVQCLDEVYRILSEADAQIVSDQFFFNFTGILCDFFVQISESASEGFHQNHEI